MSPRDLERGARAELKTLTKENADFVASHLLMASRLLDTDPELAHQHALSAARKGGRIGVVRETLAITAYTVGDFALALRELRTFRRISGSNDQLPLMVDSERGVGRPDRALELGRSVPRETLSPTVQAALAIAMSGARLDLGQPEAALSELEIPQLDPDTAYDYSPPLYRAYAEVLEELGRTEDAASWRRRADVADEALAPDDDDDLIEIEDVAVDEEDAPVDLATDAVDEQLGDEFGDLPDELTEAADESELETVADEAAPESAVAEESADDFAGEEPAAEAVAEEPAVEEPAAEEPAAEEPVVEEPPVEDSAVEDSAVEDSAAEPAEAETSDAQEGR